MLAAFTCIDWAESANPETKLSAPWVVVIVFALNDWKDWVVPWKPLELLVEKTFVSTTSAEFLASTEGI